MLFSELKDSAKGAFLAFLTFSLVLSAIPVPVATAASAPLFSITVLAPTSNPVRRQWAAIITNSLQSVGIDAKLVFTSFGVMLNIAFNCPVGCPTPTYDKGGFDVLFVGFGGGTPLPDFGTQNVVVYRNEGAGDVPPIGSNYYFFKNSTYNSLADQYSTAFDPATRESIGQQMISIVAQERPNFPIFYPADVYPYTSSFHPWGSTTSLSPSTVTQDYQHYVMSSGTTMNIGETGDINAAPSWVIRTSVQNSFYNAYLTQVVNAQLEELDPRSLAYYNALANNVVSSTDHLTWTVSFKPHTFQDGVAVTADDYIFGTMAELRNDVGFVGEGTVQGLLGLQTQFTFLNGTTRYVNNGTYSMTQPAGWTATSEWTSVDATTFKFTLPAPYVFADPVLTGGGALPMHIYEKVPAADWSTSFLAGFTSSSGGLSTSPVTVTWNTGRYGGNGSYAWVYGPVGDGPYMYRGYDPVAEVGTLVKWDGYWNATGLASIGAFGIKTIHVVHISAKDAAIAAYSNGQLNWMDSNYQFNQDDITALKGLGATVAIATDPSTGWQEMGANMNHPIIGTGTGTPLGQSDPSKAAFAARLVRKAISYLIPRQFIINSLLQGIGKIGITQFCSCYSAYYPSDVQADPYDPTQAKSFLAAAGFNTGVAPPSTGGTFSFPPISPITIGSTTISVPNFLLGNTFTVSGAFSVDPVIAVSNGGFAVVLQQSKDGGTTWTPVTFALTTPGTAAYTVSYPPTATGSLSFRILFTGIGANYVTATTLNNASLIQQQLFTDFGGKAPSVGRAANSTTPQYGPVTQLTVGTLGDVVNAVVQAQSAQLQSAANQLTTSLNTLQSNTQDGLNSLQTSAAKATDLSNLQTSLNTQISTLNGNVSNLTNVAYAALAVAVVLGLLAIGLSFRKRS